MMMGCKCKLSQVALITNKCKGCNRTFCNTHTYIGTHACTAIHEVVAKELSTLTTQLVKVGDKLPERV